MKAFWIFPGVIAVVLGAILIFAPSALPLQLLFGATFLMIGSIATYIAIFSED